MIDSSIPPNGLDPEPHAGKHLAVEQRWTHGRALTWRQLGVQHVSVTSVPPSGLDLEVHADELSPLLEGLRQAWSRIEQFPVHPQRPLVVSRPIYDELLRRKWIDDSGRLVVPIEAL